MANKTLNLSLTQRQLCEKLAERMHSNNVRVSGLQSFIIQLMIDGSPQFTVEDLKELGIISSNLSLPSVSWTTDPVVNGNFLESKSVLFTHENDTYVNEHNFTTIADAFGAGTITDHTGVPVMTRVRESGFITLLSYARSIFDYGTSGIETDLVCYIGTTRYLVCHLQIVGDSVIITDQSSELSVLMTSLSVVVAGTQMIGELCQALSDGLHSPADLFAILGNYVNSGASSVASFARRVLAKGRESIQNAVFSIVSLFRDTFGNYSEDEDGNIKWAIDTHPVSTNFWAVAGNILVGGMQTLGTILYFSGWVLGKIVGGVLFVGSSIIQAITTFTGTIAGTTPLINDDAIDQCYHDPIGQCDDQDVTMFGFSDILMTQLRTYNRAKILGNSFTLYLYNYNDTAKTLSWKLFANMSNPCPALELNSITLGKFPAVIPTLNGSTWAQGFANLWIANTSSYATDKYWGFSITDNGGVRDRITGQGTLIESLTSPRSMDEFYLDSTAASNSQNGVSITTRSADAGDWIPLWTVLRLNTIQTLSYIFSNRMFYSDDDEEVVCNSTQDYYGYRLGSLFYYRGYTGADGYDDIINCIISLSNKDHSNDRFLLSLLHTLGLVTNQRHTSTTIKCKEMSISTNGASCSASFTTRNVSISVGNYVFQDEATGIFPFMSIDPYAYVTPPTSDYKSIIWGAIVATALVSAVVVGFMATKAIVKKKLSLKMQAKGSELLEEGEVFRNGFTSDEFKQLTPADRTEYMKAWKRYNLKVNIYNFAAKMLGLSSLDWVNNWWNAYEPATGAMVSPTVSEISPDAIAASADVVDSVGSIYKYATDPEGYGGVQTDAILLYRLISGSNP